MKVDLTTVFPTFQLETKSWDNGVRVNDTRFLDFFTFAGSTILSFSRLKADPSLLTTKQVKDIEEIASQIIDTSGLVINNFTIVHDKEIEVDGLEWPDSDGQSMLTYFFMSQRIDHWTPPDFIIEPCIT
jgi:hypothetical protein